MHHNGLLGIVKALMASQDQRCDGQSLHLSPLDQGKAVFPGHFDICDHEIHCFLSDNLPGLSGTVSGKHLIDPQSFPVQGVDDALNDIKFVVYN